MKRYFFLSVLLICTLSGFGQLPDGIRKVAVLEVVDREGRVDYATKLMLRSTLAAAITNTPGYEGYDRVDISQIMGEQNFQRTGMVSDDQIRKLGEIAGVSYILVAEAAKFPDGHLLITAKILNVESAKLESTSNVQSGTTDRELETACNKLAASLLNSSSGRGSASAYQPQQQTGSHRNGEVYNPDGIEMIYVEGTGTGILATKGFYIGKYEVTQAQWKAVMGNNPSEFTGDNHPVECVSWNDVQKFISKLNSMTGRTYSLPTEAQWEYAARGGKAKETYEYAGSNNINAVAWYGEDWDTGSTHPVGQKQPNELGIYDMSGNVWEWCSDYYDSGGSYRVARGGSWRYIANICRVSYRGDYYPDFHGSDCGFRLVLVP